MILAPGLPREKIKRSSNHNRAPPSNRSNKRTKNAAQSSRSAGSARPSDEPTEWELRMRRQAETFDKLRPGNVEKMYETFPARRDLRERIDGSVQQMYQTAVDAEARTQCCDHCCCVGMPEEDGIALLPVHQLRSVVVVHFGSTFVLQVTNHQCKVCGSVITVHPFAADCAPTTPTEYCETWITLLTLQFFEDVYLTNGLSADGELQFFVCLDGAIAPAKYYLSLLGCFGVLCNLICTKFVIFSALQHFCTP